MTVAELEPECFVCGESVDPEDDFCHGCSTLICVNCVEMGPLGPHAPEAHLNEEE